MVDTREYYCKDFQTADGIGLIADLHNVKCYIRGDYHIIKIEQELDGITHHQFANYINCITAIEDFIRE